MKHKNASLAAFLSLMALVVPLSADQRPSFSFGGKQFYVGMSMPDAVQLLSECCEVSPPIGVHEKNPLKARGGDFILKKGDTEGSMLGVIFFADQKVARLTRPIADDVDFSNRAHFEHPALRLVSLKT